MRRPDHRRGLCRGVRGDERPGRGGRRQRGKPPSEPGNSRRGSCWDAALRGFSNAEPAPSSSPSKDPRSPPPAAPFRSGLPLPSPQVFPPPSARTSPVPSAASRSPSLAPGFRPAPVFSRPAAPGRLLSFSALAGVPRPTLPPGPAPPRPAGSRGVWKALPSPAAGFPPQQRRSAARAGPRRRKAAEKERGRASERAGPASP